jgi:hypothetical protein
MFFYCSNGNVHSLGAVPYLGAPVPDVQFIKTPLRGRYESVTSLLLLALLASGELERLTKLVAQSGRVLEIGISASERLAAPPKLAPGAPPLVSFRLLEGASRHRFHNLDLVLDDAGH